ncbi:AAA family ATPase [Blastopirellula retiformator]|uniref:HD domain protein n=1 Tax=Blastopirellula retiformator TaxID=2527970 RepID=A0A5C5VLX9_9BACT|nr:AAA family ATPase [Blastopirellula retiformator]TWT38980.1 HD domain protein [Blastopirellula retiformator]
MNWEQLKNATVDEVAAWAETQPWCAAMAACAQDAQWHAEGDVWTHTKMVLQELRRLDEWSSLPQRDQTNLTFTALFHDIAKPLTTEVDSVTGHVRSPKHAVKGEHLARAILRDLGCDLLTREAIARMVRNHGRPTFLLERSEPTHEVVRLSWLVNNRLLYLFALADTRGRDTDSMSRPEENLHYWKLASEEAGCYDQPYPFATEHARFTFFRQAEPNLHYVPHEDFRCTVTLLSGLPGSGKDTWIAQNRSELPIVALDDIRVELDIDPTDNQGEVAQLARERCRELLRANKSFAFNATNTMRLTRGRWLDLFNDYGARIEIVYLEPSLKQILAQNKARSSQVPETVIRKLAERCEPPTWLECHRLEYGDSAE